MKNATLSVAQNISHWLDLSRGPVLQLTLRCIRIPSPCSLRAVFGGRGGRGGNQQKKGPTLHLDLFVNLKDLYLGAQIEVEISKQVVCDRCRGSGAKSHEDVVRPTHCASRHAPCGLKIEHLCLPPPPFFILAGSLVCPREQHTIHQPCTSGNTCNRAPSLAFCSSTMLTDTGCLVYASVTGPVQKMPRQGNHHYAAPARPWLCPADAV